MKVIIGVDIGGTNTAIGVVDETGTCVRKNAVPSNTQPDAEKYGQELSQAIKKLVEQQTDAELMGIGIGAPNGNFHRGTIEHAPNLKFNGIVPLVEIVKRYFDAPVFLTNDANAAALGEKIYGGARDINDFIMITLGTGVGSGIFVNGQMLYGHDGFAGELGHTIAIPGGRQCNCGRKGCLETYCSANGLKRTVFEMLASNNADSSLRDYSYHQLTSKAIAEEAMKGDKIAQKAFAYTGKILGKQLTDFVAFSSPEAIFLFGGLVNAGDILLEPVKNHFHENLMTIFKGKVRILESEIKEGDAPIIGASALVWNEI
ncbi:MAG: ROK family protein [Bacteroidales bacterium]|nr:ROK family protein [Bacteroidales bacterium]MCF8337983.1 ROK family protein [Bacteroidales bacterium]